MRKWKSWHGWRNSSFTASPDKFFRSNLDGCTISKNYSEFFRWCLAFSFISNWNLFLVCPVEPALRTLRYYEQFSWSRPKADIFKGKIYYPVSKFVMVIIRFRVQCAINLHEWAYQKAEISRAVSGSCLKVHTGDHEWPPMTTRDYEWPTEWPRVRITS